MNAELQLDSNRIEALAGNIQDALVGIENVDEVWDAILYKLVQLYDIVKSLVTWGNQ